MALGMTPVPPSKEAALELYDRLEPEKKSQKQVEDEASRSAEEPSRGGGR